MSVDTRKKLIVINNKIQTKDIESYYFDKIIYKYKVFYKNSNKEYKVNVQNFLIIENPVELDMEMYKIYIRNGTELFNIKKIYKFEKGETYYHIIFNDDFEKSYKENEIEIKESWLLNNKVKEKIEYLKIISKFNNLKNIETNEQLLSKKIEKIDFFVDSALKTYLKNDLICKKSVSYLIFPFGCNNSQYNAVNNALTNGMSVIEDPPGTGKTQTILNIIANLIINNNNVQVVSNNNSAIENIYEKMEKNSLDFIMAILGKRENKENFINNQKGIYPDLEKWQVKNIDLIINEIIIKTKKMKIYFDANKKNAFLMGKLKEFEFEKNYYHRYIQDNNLDTFWIENSKKIKSDRLLKILLNIEKNKKFGIIDKIRCYICGVNRKKDFYKLDVSVVIVNLQYLFLKLKIEEIQKEIEKNKKIIISNQNILQEITELSMLILKNHLGKKYINKKERKIFNEREIVNNEFLDEYPVILSTTFSSSSNLRNKTFDYLIMDEASQVDVVTGAMALSTAKNAVIVGDLKQLPNVVDAETKKMANVMLNGIKMPYGLEYDISFLQSVVKVLPKVARVLLKEHYRCHPKIIGFCNKEFYNNELLIMTKDKSEECVIKCYKTVKGNHETDKKNQREVDVIINEILPQIQKNSTCDINVGIITPYNNQVKKIEKNIKENSLINNIEVGTIHKFQGREKDVIIISTVDNEDTKFIDDNMLNVAISRAKNQLYLVTNGNDGGVGKNVNDFIDYIKYNNFEVVESKIRSIFDCLYKQYDNKRKELTAKIKKVSQYDSENLMYDVILKVLKNKYEKYDVLHNYPMNILIKDYSLLKDDIEKSYASNSFTHIDFLIYNKVSKKPILAVEVDGYTYHKEGTKQYQRDLMKNNILQIYNIPEIRFSTKDSKIEEKLEKKIYEVSV